MSSLRPSDRLVPFLGLDALQWFVALDTTILLVSVGVAAVLFRKLRAQGIMPRASQHERADEAGEG